MSVSLPLLKPFNQTFRKVKSLARNAYIAYPKIVECNLCGWQGRRFTSDCWHPYTICPKCGSQVRHRLLVNALFSIDGLSYKEIVQNKSVLHFAPEKSLKSLLETYAANYTTANYLGDKADKKLDISDMKSVEDCEFDLLIACDILEHVYNDLSAMKEIHRVLSPGGYAIITVPQKDDLKHTFEDPSIVNAEERERVFGQWDHLRIYGDNFPTMLESVGFKVTVINEANFPEELVNKHTLFPPVLSKNSLATNYRKIFFAQKTP